VGRAPPRPPPAPADQYEQRQDAQHRDAGHADGDYQRDARPAHGGRHEVHDGHAEADGAHLHEDQAQLHDALRGRGWVGGRMLPAHMLVFFFTT